MKYTTRTTQVMVMPEGEEIFSENATSITIRDDAGGEYLVIAQCNDDSEKGEIKLCSEEWPEVRKAIDDMFSEIERHSPVQRIK